MKYIMALDSGTTSCRCILFDQSGTIRAMEKEEFPQYYPVPGWVEHDAMEIWNCQIKAARSALQYNNISASDIAAIGIANQRETTVVWDKNTGEPIYHAIVWQCRRTAEYIDSLKENGYADMIQEKTGLIPDAYFSASKIKWILDHVEGSRERAQKGELLFGTIDTWIIWNLTAGKVHVTDYTNASRTMLFNIKELCWDDDLLKLFDIPREMLPDVKPSSYVYGESAAALFGSSIPISGVAGDQQAALFGQCCFDPGDIKNTYGTGCFLLMNTGKKIVRSHNGLLTTIAVGANGEVEYALEGSVFIGGAVIQWLRDELRVIDQSPDSEFFASKEADTGGVYFVPAFVGLGAPYWNPYAHGCIVGLTRGTGKAHIIRAALESIAFQTMDVCQAMARDAGIPINRLKVDGGASQNDLLMQFQSDIMNVEVFRPKCVETTALGAAYLSGLTVGFWRDRKSVEENWCIDRVFRAGMDEETRTRKQRDWARAVQCTMNWGQP